MYTLNHYIFLKSFKILKEKQSYQEIPFKKKQIFLAFSICLSNFIILDACLNSKEKGCGCGLVGQIWKELGAGKL